MSCASPNRSLKRRNGRLGTIRKGVDFQRFLVERPAQDQVLTTDIVVVEQVAKEARVPEERRIVQVLRRRSEPPAKLPIRKKEVRTGWPLNRRAIPAAVRADPTWYKHTVKIP